MNQSTPTQPKRILVVSLRPNFADSIELSAPQGTLIVRVEDAATAIHCLNLGGIDGVVYEAGPQDLALEGNVARVVAASNSAPVAVWASVLNPDALSDAYECGVSVVVCPPVRPNAARGILHRLCVDPPTTMVPAVAAQSHADAPFRLPPYSTIPETVDALLQRVGTALHRFARINRVAFFLDNDQGFLACSQAFGAVDPTAARLFRLSWTSGLGARIKARGGIVTSSDTDTFARKELAMLGASTAIPLRPPSRAIIGLVLVDEYLTGEPISPAVLGEIFDMLTLVAADIETLAFGACERRRLGAFFAALSALPYPVVAIDHTQAVLAYNAAAVALFGGNTFNHIPQAVGSLAFIAQTRVVPATLYVDANGGRWIANAPHDTLARITTLTLTPAPSDPKIEVMPPVVAEAVNKSVPIVVPPKEPAAAPTPEAKPEPIAVA
jgi:hypothetical protein